MAARSVLAIRRAENDARILEVVERHGSPERVERLKGQAGGKEHEYLASEQLRALADIVEDLAARTPAKKGKK